MPGISKRVLAYGTTIRLSLHNSLSNRSTILTIVFFWFFLLIVLFIVYKTAFLQGSTANIRLSLPDVLWALAMYNILLVNGARFVPRDMNADVRTGSVETFLTKPVSYPLYIAAFRFGRSFTSSVITVFVTGLLCIVLVGVPEYVFSWIWGMEFLFLFFFSQILSYLFFTLIGLTAFWVEDSTPILWIFDKIAMVLAGAIVPVALLPVLFRRISEYSPFGALNAAARMFDQHFATSFPQIFGSVLFWCIVLTLFGWLFWKKTEKRLFIHGG